MLKKIFKNNSGFTLIEIIIVLVLISLIATVTIPKISGISGNKRENFIILTGIIGKIFDDAFLNDRVTYLIIHLHDSRDPILDTFEENDPQYEIFSRQNGISCVHYDDGRFTDCPGRMLKHREFPDSFVLEKVILPNGGTADSGNIILPFYPQGFSENMIIHLTADDADWSIRIDKHIKEPVIIREHVTFDNMEF